MVLGMYTVMYIGTIYVYRRFLNYARIFKIYQTGIYIVTRNASNRRLVPAAITVLYLSNVVGFGVQWYSTKWEFVNNGDTRNSVFQSLYIVPTLRKTLRRIFPLC